MLEDLNVLDAQFADYSSMRETWKKEIEASEFELQERKEAETAEPIRMDEELGVCYKQAIPQLAAFEYLFSFFECRP